MNHRENVETGKPKDRAIAQEAWLIMKVNGGTNKQLSREAIPKHARSAPALLVARFQLKKNGYGQTENLRILTGLLKGA